MLSEADVTKQIRDVLNTARVFHWKAWQGPMSQPKGVSDILGIFKGRMLAIEVKKQGWEPPSPGTYAYGHYLKQQAFIDRINAECGIGFFATSVEEVIDALKLGFEITPLFRREGPKS